MAKNAEAWSQSFDEYESYVWLEGCGDLYGAGAWTGWGGDPTLCGLTSTEVVLTAPNALRVEDLTDCVFPFWWHYAGQWLFRCSLYVPPEFESGNLGGIPGSAIVLLSEYSNAGPWGWSVQLRADSESELYIRDGDPPSALPLVRGRWVEVRVEIDLAADLYQVFYDGQPLGVPESWSAGVYGTGGVLDIGAIDFYANGSSPVYYDDVALVPLSEPALPGDLNCDGVVDFGDINPFVLRLSNPTEYHNQYPDCPDANGDINGDGSVNFGDINPFVALLSGG
jgi:hypothetical protein